MAKKQTTAKTVEAIKHKEAKRKNIPTAEYQSVLQKTEQSPVRVAYERRIRTAFADQVPVEPLLGDAFQLAKEMKLGVFAWVTPPVQDKVRCQLIQNL